MRSAGARLWVAGSGVTEPTGLRGTPLEERLIRGTKKNSPQYEKGISRFCSDKMTGIAPETGILHRKLHQKPEFCTGNQDFAPEISPEIENLHQNHPFLVQFLKGLYQICHKIVTNLYQIAPEISRSRRLSPGQGQTRRPSWQLCQKVWPSFPSPARNRLPGAQRSFYERAPAAARRRARSRTEWVGASEAPSRAPKNR